MQISVLIFMLKKRSPAMYRHPALIFFFNSNHVGAILLTQDFWIVYIRDRLQVLLLILSKLTQINQLLFSQKSSENRFFLMVLGVTWYFLENAFPFTFCQFLHLRFAAGSFQFRSVHKTDFSE